MLPRSPFGTPRRSWPVPLPFWLMTTGRRVSAVTDDALGTLDTIGLVEAIQGGEVGVARGRRRRDRPRAGGRRRPRRDGLHRLRPGPCRGARPPRRLLRRRTDGGQGQLRRRRHADPRGHRRVDPHAGQGRRRLRPDVPRHRAPAARQEPAVRVRLLGGRRAPPPGAGPLPVVARPPGRCVVGRLGRAGRLGRPADRPRQRRRRLDPDPRGGQRTGRSQADARPAGPGQDDARDAGAHRVRRRRDPHACATPRRSTARPSTSTARCR